MDWIGILQIVLPTGLLVGIVEFFRFKRKDKAEASNVEQESLEKAYRNSILSIETNKTLVEHLRGQIQDITEDSKKERDEYRRMMQEAHAEIANLKKRVDELLLNDAKNELLQANREIARLKKTAEELENENADLKKELKGEKRNPL